MKESKKASKNVTLSLFGRSESRLIVGVTRSLFACVITELSPDWAAGERVLRARGASLRFWLRHTPPRGSVSIIAARELLKEEEEEEGWHICPRAMRTHSPPVHAAHVPELGDYSIMERI
ncbi:unnamed protein product [Pleuronectes platessa]|uniref:Uncharacterized protein n=1 Tax=Pleuronectes platessa TaxID=8262 RepID=A0A9N7VHL3_PLEPL|nr:unnamed protein product [Pleuronectes platessa]